MGDPGDRGPTDAPDVAVYPCPNCRGPVVPGSAACERCGVVLVGPLAEELGEVDAALVRLGQRRRELLAALRAARPGGPDWSGPGATAGPGGLPAGPSGLPTHPTIHLPAQRPVLGGQQLLLALGVLLVLTASVVFLAVNWSVLGALGQLGVALTAAGSCAWLSWWALRRSLRSSAEAFAGLAVLLLAATAVGAQLLDLLPSVDDAAFGAAAAGVIALVCVGLAELIALRAYRIAAPVAAQFVLPWVAVAADAPPPLVLAAIAAGGLAAVGLAGRWEPTTASVLGVVTWVIAVPLGLVGIWAGDHPVRYAAVVAGACAGSWLVRDHPLRVLSSGAASVAVASVLYRSVGPVSAALVAGATVAPALVLRSRAALQLQVAAIAAAAVTTLAALASSDPGVFAAGAGLLWVIAVRNLLVAPVALGPATLLFATGLVVAADAGLRVGLVATSWALAAVAVAVTELPGRVPPAPRTRVLVGVAGAYATVCVVGALGLADASTVAIDADLVGLQRAAAAGLVAAAVGVVWVAWRVRLPLLSAVAAGAASAAWWFAVASTSLAAVEWYSLPAAALFAGAGFGWLRRWNSFVALGPAAVLALAPTAFVAVVDEDLVRLALALVAAGAVAVVAVWWRRAAPFYAAMAALAWLMVGQLNNWSAYVPRWAVLAAVGAALLAAGVGFELSRRFARSTLTFLRSLH